jgi:hypothetical protein
MVILEAELELIHELQKKRGILPDFELAERARQILDRTGLKRIDLAIYLQDHGYEGSRLAQAVGTFGKAVKDAYRARYGCDPIKATEVVGNDVRPVFHYLEADRPLIDETFAGWSA